MIPRGEVGLVFAGLGAATEVLSESLDAAVIVMVIMTTLIAPLLLKVVFPSATGEILKSNVFIRNIISNCINSYKQSLLNVPYSINYLLSQPLMLKTIIISPMPNH